MLKKKTITVITNIIWKTEGIWPKWMSLSYTVPEIWQNVAVIVYFKCDQQDCGKCCAKVTMPSFSLPTCSLSLWYQTLYCIWCGEVEGP